MPQHPATRVHWQRGSSHLARSGICNIVIWGYAENGVGLFVGNVSTLRPLFRRVLSLGGSDSVPKPTGSGVPSGLPGRAQYHSHESVTSTLPLHLMTLLLAAVVPKTRRASRAEGRGGVDFVAGGGAMRME